MFNRVYAFLEKYKYIYQLQFGFRSQHSTNHALIEITETIRKALDDGKYACGVFVDFQKAFEGLFPLTLLGEKGALPDAKAISFIATFCSRNARSGGRVSHWTGEARIKMQIIRKTFYCVEEERDLEIHGGLGNDKERRPRPNVKGYVNRRGGNYPFPPAFLGYLWHCPLAEQDVQGDTSP